MVLGALASRDWRPMHHDHDFAVNRNGTQDIFLNTPNQAAWFERYLTDWSGPTGRLGRMKFRMKGSVFPGDTMVLRGTVDDVTHRRRGLWLGRRCSMTLSVDGDIKTECTGADRAARLRIRQPVDAPRRRLAALERTRSDGSRPHMPSRRCCAELVRGVCATYAPLETVRELEDDPVGYPIELWKQLGELDLIGLMLPPEFGGSGMSMLEGAVVYEELGRALAPVAALRERGDERGRAPARGQRRAEADVAATDRVGRRRSSRPPGSSPAAASRPKACSCRPAPTATSSCSTARSGTCRSRPARDQLVVLARTDAGVDLFLVDPKAPGVTLTQQMTIASDAQYAVELERRARAGGESHRRRRQRLGDLERHAARGLSSSWPRR